MAQTGSQLAIAASSAAEAMDTMSRVGRRQPASGAGAPSIELAKGAMMEAMVHATAAGEAARIAKESYEEVMRAPRQAGESGSKQVLSEIKREAGEQAKEALLIRLKYEDNAKKTAIKKARATAKVYRDAMNRDIGIGATWQLRASEYATAAGQRKGMAIKWAREAEKYRALSEWGLARQYILQAHQAMDQASQFAGRSEDAHKQANAINGASKWYLYAEQAAAANMLAKSMPPDLPPPDMPTLP